MTETHVAGAATDALPGSPGEHLSSPVTRSVLAIQHRMLIAVRDFLGTRGFIELLAPIIGPVTDPGARGAKQVDVDYYGHRYKLMTSAILYKQASLTAFNKIFFIAPNVRLEPLETASTHRHLAEFHQIDVEVADASRDDAMQLAEDMIVAVVRAVSASLPGNWIGSGGTPARSPGCCPSHSTGYRTPTRWPTCTAWGTRRARTRRSTGPER